MMQLSIIGIYGMEGETNAGVVAKEKGRDVERERAHSGSQTTRANRKREQKGI